MVGGIHDGEEGSSREKENRADPQKYHRGGFSCHENGIINNFGGDAFDVDSSNFITEYEGKCAKNPLHHKSVLLKFIFRKLSRGPQQQGPLLGMGVSDDGEAKLRR
ncbi:hypothetical protein D3C86_1850850 [compost metagenome]